MYVHKYIHTSAHLSLRAYVAYAFDTCANIVSAVVIKFIRFFPNDELDNTMRLHTYMIFSKRNAIISYGFTLLRRRRSLIYGAEASKNDEISQRERIPKIGINRLNWAQVNVQTIYPLSNIELSI
jgi:hypothetical protein